MRNILVLIFSILSVTCQSQDPVYNREAIDLNNRALEVLRGAGNLTSRIKKSNSLLDSAIRVDSRYVVAYYNKLNNLITIGNYKAALIVADATIKLKPGLEISTAKSALLFKSGDVKAAKINLVKATKEATAEYNRKPSVALLCNIAAAHVLTGGSQKALNVLDSEINRLNAKEKKQVISVKKYISSLTYDAILNSHQVKVKSITHKAPSTKLFSSTPF